MQLPIKRDKNQGEFERRIQKENVGEKHVCFHFVHRRLPGLHEKNVSPLQRLLEHLISKRQKRLVDTVFFCDSFDLLATKTALEMK